MRGDKKLTITQGSVLIYNNFRLCENEVANFKKLLVGNEPRHDYMLNNGHNKKCKNDEIKTEFQVISHDKVIISWIDKSIVNLTNMDDFPGYLIQFVAIEDSEKKEVDDNMLYERDICSSFGWKNALVKKEDVSVENGSYRFTLNNLTQYTTYAFTVQLYYYETAEAMNGYSNLSSRGASEAIVFKTKMIRPSRVTKFTTTLKTIDSISLVFDVKSNERSVIDNFLVHFFEENYFDANVIDQRNYCLNPVSSDSVINSLASESLKNRYDDRENCCERCCDERRKAREVNDDTFRDNLIKFSDNKVRKNQQNHLLKMRRMKGFKDQIIINGSLRTYTVTKLKPFTFYKFHIYACTIETCSEYEILTEKTAHHEKYDRVVLHPIVNDLNNKFVVYFDEPKLKNGAIVNYIVELREVKENSSHLLSSECITRKMHEKKKYR